MSVSTVTTPSAPAGRAPRTSSAGCCGTPAATPMPTSQRPSRTCARRRVPRASQPKRSAPVAQSSARGGAARSGTVRLLGVDLGVVEDAELDRVEAQLLGHLVHRDLERHHAGRLAWRPHGVAFRQVERRKPHRGQTVGAGIEQPRLVGRRVSGWPPGRSPDPLSCAMAVMLPSRVGADPNALTRRRPVRRVVHHERPRQRNLDRAAPPPSRPAPPSPHRSAGTACRRSRRR